MIRYTLQLSEILDFLSDKVLMIYGPKDEVYIDNIADVAHTTSTTLDWVHNQKKNKQSIVEGSKAKVILVDPTVNYSDLMRKQNKTLIVVNDPKLALALVGNKFFIRKPAAGIHPTAIIDPDATLGDNVCVGPYSIICKATIGDNCVISSHVHIYDDVIIGHDCKIREGAILGGEGFGFEKDDAGNWFRFPQIGSLRIGNFVEIGPYTCIDRGALSETVVGDYCKMDAYVHIAHNNQVGKNVVFTGSSGLGGSCNVGDDVWMGPAAMANNWVNIGANAYVCMGSVVLTNVKEGKKVIGYPAHKLEF